MDKKLVTYSVLTYNRKDDLKECLDSILAQQYRPIEIVVVDNNSTDGTDTLFDEKYSSPIFRYFKLEKNYGVAKGRNIAIEKAKGEIIITIDDDAILPYQDSTDKIIKELNSDEKIGVITFKVLDSNTNQLIRRSFPHKNKKLDPNTEFEATYFSGGANAIRKSVLEAVGLYKDFFYGMEELDLSYRILDYDYRIIYFPEAAILHKRTPRSRVAGEWEHLLTNRMKTLYSNLPWRFFLINTFFWICVTLIKTGNPILILRSLKTFSTDFNGIKRRVISKKTIKRIKKLDGRLYR